MIKRPLCLAAVLFLGIQAILTAGVQIADDLKPSPLELHADEGDTLTLQGTVSRREEKPKYQVYYLTDNQVCLDDQVIEESKILVYIEQSKIQTEYNEFQVNQSGSQTGQSELQLKAGRSQDEWFAVGNRIQITGTVRFFQEATNPGNFDQKFYYQKQGIHASVWAEQTKLVDPAVSYVREKLTRLRSRWKALLVSALGDYYGNSMSAILLGDKSELDADLKELYQKSGIGHILAISGLHMSFIGIGVYQILRRTGLGFVPAGGIGILFLTCYALMIGFGVSSLRALVMFVVRIGADMSGRDYDLPTSLSLAAAVIVLRQPLYLLDAGFLLSFGALLGIAFINPLLENLHIVPKILCAGISIHLTLLPVLLYYYFELPIYSLLLNLLVIPLMSVVLGVGILGSVLLVVSENAGTALLQICKVILWIYEQAGELTMKLPAARLVLGQSGKIQTVVYYVILFGGGVIVSMYLQMREKEKECANTGSGKKKESEKNRKGKGLCRIVLRTGMICLPVLFCLVCWSGHGKSGELKVVVLDVGQGDGLYVRTPSGGHYLIDGGSTDVSGVGEYRIEPFLKSQGVGTLGYVFVSHGDEDHMNGIQELLENQDLGVRVDTLVLPPEHVLDDALKELAALAIESGTKVVTIQAGQQISDAGMTLTCLAPSEEYSGELGNASSMVLALQYKEFDMLFTGDVEGEGEKELTANEELKSYDVLKVAHHGSRNSTTEQFLEQTKPGIALISAGRENRYGHPHEETIQRLEACGSEIFSTQDCGAILLATDGKKITVQRYLRR